MTRKIKKNSSKISSFEKGFLINENTLKIYYKK